MPITEKQKLGSFIRTYRLLKGLSQADFGRRIFVDKKTAVAGKYIAEVEAGKRELKPNEKEKLDLFPDFKVYYDNLLSSRMFEDFASDPDGYSPLVVPREKFKATQQELIKNNHGTYEMHFGNAVHVPMFHDKSLQETWPTNIARGVNYSLYFDLDRFDSDEDQERFWLFLVAAKEIIEDLEKIESKDGKQATRNHFEDEVCGIDVFGLLPFGMDKKSEASVSIYEQAKHDFSRFDRIRIHEVFAEPVSKMNVKCRRLFLDCFSMDASTLLYMPKHKYERSVSNLELRDRATGHQSSGEFGDKHVFYTNKTSNYQSRLFREFNIYLREKFASQPK